MKEQIYTIPVNEGFDEGGECPFCTMREKLEKDALSYTLGPSYMEQDVRDKTNEIGFCDEHYKAMYNSQNRLGLALMVSTHMAEVQNKMTRLLEEETKPQKKGIFKKKKESTLKTYAQNVQSRCFVCEKTESSMDRYFKTFFHLWKKEEEFKNKVKNSKGFCIKHFERLASMSCDELSIKQREELLETIVPLQNENMERVREELLWFISKFDYRFTDEPWGNSKDSLQRAIIKVASCNTEKKYDVSR